MRIKDLPKIERPREKLQKYGPEKLSDSELLALLLRTGTKGVNVVELSGRILARFGSKGLATAGVTDLKKSCGLGTAKACEIVACMELGRRILKDKKSRILLAPHDVWRELAEIRSRKKEHFAVLFLDSRNQEIRREIISVGTLNANLVHPREVFESAIAHSAAHIIVAHNHPSGDTEPSPEDLAVTKKLADAGKILGIEIADHVIVAPSGYVSFRERGLLL